MKVKIGIIGAGKWGKNHVRTFSQLDCKLVGLADINPKCEELTKEHNIQLLMHLLMEPNLQQLIKWEVFLRCLISK